MYSKYELHIINICILILFKYSNIFIFYYQLKMFGTNLSSIRHRPSRTLQLDLKSSNNLIHFFSGEHTERAWLQVGNASTGYGSLSVNKTRNRDTMNHVYITMYNEKLYY
jgi:hypothetical protein